MFSVWGRIKNWVMGLLLAALPILYAVGRREGDRQREIELLRNTAKTSDEIADFYRRMGEYPHEDDPSMHNSSDLTDRLRSRGL